MQNTTNYNFNLPEGTDLWNYLTQTNPNFTALDTILKSVSDATVTTATEVTSGTAHAVTRTLPDANVIRFTATGVWTLGDTMTIDGTPVTVVKPNGTSLQTGDYIIGSEVLGVLRATQFTVYVGGVSSLDATDVTYDNTGSGLTATDVQDAIDEVNSNLSGYQEFITDGVENWRALCQRIYNSVNWSNVTPKSVVDALMYGGIYQATIISSTAAGYTNTVVRTNSQNVRTSLLYFANNADAGLYEVTGSTYTDHRTAIPSAGSVIRIYN